MKKNEIAESEVLDLEVELEVFNEVAAAVKAAKERCANIILKYETPKDIKDAKSFIYDIRLLKAPITQAHKMAKAQLLVDGRAMDAKKNMLIGALDEMIDKQYAPIKVIEDAEAKQKADEEAKVKAEEERMEAERQAEIEAAQKKLAEEQELLRQEQAAFAQKEREKAIADDAENQAKRAAQVEVLKARQLTIAADESRKRETEAAENRRIADVQRAKDEAAAATAEKDRMYQLELESQEQERIAEAQAKEQVVIEAQRVAREKKEAEEMAETKRINDEAHRSTIHKTIYKWFRGMGFDEHECQCLTQDLIDGRIPHTKIEY